MSTADNNIDKVQYGSVEANFKIIGKKVVRRSITDNNIEKAQQGSFEIKLKIIGKLVVNRCRQQTTTVTKFNKDLLRLSPKQSEK